MILLQAPAADMTFGGCPSGSVYTSDQNKLIYLENNSIADQLYLQENSCYLLSAFGGWGTFTFLTLAELYAADSAMGLVLPGVVGFPGNTTCLVLDDASSSNDGSWFKTGTGNGSGNWTYNPIITGSAASSSVLAAQAAAAASATAAAGSAAGSASSATAAASSAASATTSLTAAQAVAAMAGRYPSGAATSVPKGVSASTISNAGTGGTNSTNNLATYSGGTLTYNPILIYDVVGGLVTNLRMPYPGLFIGTGTPTAPTLTLPNAGTGAALALTMGMVVASGQDYWVESADGTALLLYANVGGTATAVLLSGNPVSFPLSASFTSINASITALQTSSALLTGAATQVIGRPVNPVTGPSGSGMFTYVQGNPAGQASTLASVVLFALATGNIYLAKFTLSGGVLTRTWLSSAIAIGATGLNTLTAAQFNGGTALTVAANEYLGYFDVSGNVLTATPQTADGAGWYVYNGSPPASFSSGALNTSNQLQIQFNLSYAAQTVTAAALAVVQASVASQAGSIATLGTQVAANTSALTGLDGSGSQVIGRPVGTTLATGTASTASGFVLGDPATYNGTLTSFEFFAVAPGVLKLAKYTLSGSVFTQTWVSGNITISSAGDQTLTDAQFNGGTPLTVSAGEYFAFADVNGGMLAYSAGTADSDGWYVVDHSLPSAANNGTYSPSAYWQLRFNLAYTALVVTGDAFLAAQASIAMLETEVDGLSSASAPAYVAALHLQENLFDPSQITLNFITNTSGGLTSFPSVYDMVVTGWMSVNPGDTIAANFPTDLGLDGNCAWQFAATPGGTVISNVVGGVAGQNVTVPTGGNYVRCCFPTTAMPVGDAVVKRTNRSVGRLAAKTMWIFGDSRASIIGGVQLSYLVDRTGIKIPYSDARGGRRIDQCFEMYQVSGSPLAYGNPATGLSTGGQIGSTLPQYTDGNASVPGAPQVNHGAGIWAPNKCVFMGYVSGTSLTVTSVLYGTIVKGMSLLNSAFAIGIPNSGVTAGIGGTISAGSGTAWTLTATAGQTVGSSSAPVLFYGVNAWTTGNTLATDLANVDIVWLELGGPNDDPLHNVAAVGYATGGVLTINSFTSQSDLPVPIPVTVGMMMLSSFTGYTQLVSGVWQLVVTAMGAGSLPITAGQWLMSGSQGLVQKQLSGTTGGAGTYTLDISQTEGSSGSPIGMTCSTVVTITGQLTGTTWSINSTAAIGSSGSPINIALYGFGQVGLQQAKDGSYLGWYVWVIQQLILVKPSIKILGCIGEWAGNVGGGLAMAKPFCAAAVRSFYQYMGIPYVDQYAKSGVSAWTEAAGPNYLLSDRLHQTLIGSLNDGRLLTDEVNKAI